MPPRIKNYQQAIRHLTNDKVLAELMSRVELKTNRADKDLYRSLLRSVVSQQLSIKAAATIWERFEALFENRYPVIEQVLSYDTDQLRAVGLSKQKANYIQNIAQYFKANDAALQHVQSLTDEDLVKELTAIKGVGRWTVEMIMMFSLGREDVLPLDDLGIVNGVCSLYNIRTNDRKKRQAKILAIAENWRPYRTLACFYIWRYKDANLTNKKKPAKKRASLISKQK